MRIPGGHGDLRGVQFPWIWSSPSPHASWQGLALSTSQACGNRHFPLDRFPAGMQVLFGAGMDSTYNAIL